MARRGGRYHVMSCETVKVSFFVPKSDWEWLKTRHKNDVSATVRRLISNYRYETEGPRRPENRGRLRYRDEVKAWDLKELLSGR
jgi:hypothetical protein